MNTAIESYACLHVAPDVSGHKDIQRSQCKPITISSRHLVQVHGGGLIGLQLGGVAGGALLAQSAHRALLHDGRNVEAQQRLRRRQVQRLLQPPARRLQVVRIVEGSVAEKQ